MTDSNLDLTPPQAGQYALPPARTLTVEDTPTYWTLPAVVAWILARALSAVLELCAPLPADAIARGARRLRRIKVLWALGIDPEKANRAYEAISAAVRKWHAGAMVGKLTERERWYRGSSLIRRLKRERAEDEKIARTIDAAIGELFTKLAGKKLTAEDDHADAIPPRRFCRIPFQHFLESRVGPYDDVRIAREQVLQCWPSPSEERKARPAKEPVVESPHTEALTTTQPTRRGRPLKYDWCAFYREITRIANTPDGLPEIQAELEATMAQWCEENWGKAPTESMIRDHISKLYAELKQGRK